MLRLEFPMESNVISTGTFIPDVAMESKFGILLELSLVEFLSLAVSPISALGRMGNCSSVLSRTSGDCN